MMAVMREHRFAEDVETTLRRDTLHRYIRVLRSNREFHLLATEGRRSYSEYSRGLMVGAILFARWCNITKDYRRLVEMWRRS